MNSDFLKLSLIEEKKKNNRNMSMLMKAVAALLTFTLAFCSLTRPQTMKIAWIIEIPITCIIFILDIYYIKRNKQEEYKTYFLFQERYQHQKDISRITGEEISNTEENQKELHVPNTSVQIPLIYYLVLTVINIIGLYMSAQIK